MPLLRCWRGVLLGCFLRLLIGVNLTRRLGWTLLKSVMPTPQTRFKQDDRCMSSTTQWNPTLYRYISRNRPGNVLGFTRYLCGEGCLVSTSLFFELIGFWFRPFNPVECHTRIRRWFPTANSFLKLTPMRPSLLLQTILADCWLLIADSHSTTCL